jgi:hypothetical protein
VLDSETRELFRKDKLVHLQPKVFRVLELLLENRPRVMSKQELHERVWSDTFISEATLASAISDIRATIGDTGKKARFLRTVHGYGYAFSGEARAESARAMPGLGGVEWRLIWNEREIALSEGENLLGRDHAAAVWIDSKGVSRHHARIVIHGRTAVLEDLGSKNGTYLGGRRIDATQNVADGSEIRVGPASMVMRMLSEVDSTRTEK